MCQTRAYRMHAHAHLYTHVSTAWWPYCMMRDIAWWSHCIMITLHGGHIAWWPRFTVATSHRGRIACFHSRHTGVSRSGSGAQDLQRSSAGPNVYTHVCTRIYTQVYINTCMYTCLYTCLHTRLHAHLHTCPHTSKICNASAQVLIVCNRLLLEKLPEHPPFGLNVGGHTSQGTTIEISLNRAKEVAIHMPGYMSMHMSTHMSTHMPILLSMHPSMHMSTR